MTITAKTVKEGKFNFTVVIFKGNERLGEKVVDKSQAANASEAVAVALKWAGYPQQPQTR